MTAFILHNGQLTPVEDQTPSARKAHRQTGEGFIITTRPDTAHRNLSRYLED